MTKLVTDILSKDTLDKVRKLLDMTDFEGVDFDKDVSLFEHGFVYDSRTNTIITTHPYYVWENVDSEVRFGVDTLTTDKVKEVFNDNKGLIKESSDYTDKELSDMHYVFMINEVECTNGGLKLKTIPMTMNVDELIDFLENYDK